jgi:hypothetical protein
MFARWLTVVVGLWLVLAPLVLGHVDLQARSTEVWVGLAVAITAVVAMAVRGFRFITTGLGAWLAMAPFVLAYRSGTAIAHDVLVGLLLIALSLVPTRVGVRRRRVPPAPLTPSRYPMASPAEPMDLPPGAAPRRPVTP